MEQIGATGMRFLEFWGLTKIQDSTEERAARLKIWTKIRRPTKHLISCSIIVKNDENWTCILLLMRWFDGRRFIDFGHGVEKTAKGEVRGEWLYTYVKWSEEDIGDKLYHTSLYFQYLYNLPYRWWPHPKAQYKASFRSWPENPTSYRIGDCMQRWRQ